MLTCYNTANAQLSCSCWLWRHKFVNSTVSPFMLAKRGQCEWNVFPGACERVNVDCAACECVSPCAPGMMTECDWLLCSREGFEEVGGFKGNAAVHVTNTLVATCRNRGCWVKLLPPSASLCLSLSPSSISCSSSPSPSLRAPLPPPESVCSPSVSPHPPFSLLCHDSAPFIYLFPGKGNLPSGV